MMNYQSSDTPSSKSSDTGQEKVKRNTVEAPSISLPKGGGAIKSIDEKFSVNPANGTAGFSIPFPLSPSRNGFMPSIGLSYNSGIGNSAFGLGWNAQPSSIVRRTDKMLPSYLDNLDSDTFIFSGAEDLVVSYTKDSTGNWVKDIVVIEGLSITRYKPRIEGSFSRIEKITEPTGNVYWKVTSSSNVVSIYGKSKTAQVFNPADPSQIFRWLLEFSYDDKGNCYQLEYKKEDKVNVADVLHEKNRLNELSSFTNAYVKRIKYCNKTHFNRSSIDLVNWETFLPGIDYLLELVLDYGEHSIDNPQPDEDNGWICRQDPFSDYRAGFEIRTYRLCKRVLMFHRFSELGTSPCLVRSLDISYDSNGSFTFLTSVTHKGYIRKADGTYSQKAIPPFEFSYEPLGWDTQIKSLPSQSMDNLPTGIDDGYYKWMDLYQEGIAGIFTEQSDGWYYKSNLGEGNLSGTQVVSPKPSLSGVSKGSLHFQDIEARGQTFLVSDDLEGYYELSRENEWLPFKNFTEIPRVDMHDPNLKFLDLNGDGKADILISEEEVFLWYASKGKEGYDSYQRLQKPLDEEKGPQIVSYDSTESIVLADMSGDGLMDIVRIRNGEVSYWPNQGYGHFGAKVSMSNAPVFDYPDNFNPRYIKLADLDGSGLTGMVYMGKDSFKVYFNQCGNSWSDENIVNGINPLPFPKIDDHTTVFVIDLLGSGTACIVWSSPLPGYTPGQQMHYIDLMGGKKPHIMTGYKNNMGKEVKIHYKPSTFYYLEDKKAGTPWITKLPFPVHCVDKIEMIDQIRKSRFTNSYSYHHGYYDFIEREFRGFGRVDQTDTEDFELFKKLSNPDGSIQIVDEGFHQPPVLTKTWFHTGAFMDKEKIFSQFSHEYYSNAVVPEQEITDPPLPEDLTVDEWREALRSCKGLPLRVEVYSRDGSDKQDQPYTTVHHSCLIQLLQPRLENQFAVFRVQESESLTYTYERNPADPRIAHNMTIETDEFGNVLKAAVISYGRKMVDFNLLPGEQAEQSKIHIVFSQQNVTNTIDDETDYHLPVGYESLTYELTGITPAVGDYFSITDIKHGFEQAVVIPYEAIPTGSTKEKRLIAQARTLLLKNDMSGPLPLGTLESLALPYQSFKLSLTPSLVNFIFGDKVSDGLLMNEGKYVHFNDANYWIASGTQTMDANHFYQVTEVIDPFGSKAQVQYDTTYRFFIQKTTDALQNESSVAGFNFRTLSPYLMLDINDNRSGVRTDELGMVMSSFVMGKEGENQGDFLDSSSVEASANDQPTSILEYDLFNYINHGKPNFVKTSVRETHYFESQQTGQPVVWQTSYGYSDGNGQGIMQKIQAEPGIALEENQDGTVTEVDTTPALRWIGNGRTIFNNKGKPVKQYEPYFSTTFEFEDARELVERGVTPIITYDSAGRAIRTDMPNGTFIKVEFDSWMQQSFDQNDTVKDSQWYKDRIINQVPSIATPEEVSAANKAAAHADTPATVYLDSLGRSFIAIADNGIDGKYKTITETDIQGNPRNLTDARGNIVARYKYDMLGTQLYNLGMDDGERWIINDAMGKPLYNWDNRQHVFRAQYDSLHRPIQSFVKKDNQPEINIDKVVYGEDLPNDKHLNLRGRAYKHFDQAGIATNISYDFKGNLLQSSRQLCQDYKNDIDWNTNPSMEEEIFLLSSSFDALNRPIELTSPDESIIIPTFNETGMLNKVEVQLKGAEQKTVFVKDINYDAKGQRQSIVYGNDTSTSYQYDPKTFRLTRLLTTGKNGTDLLQKLSYTYDPVGNISFIKDEAQQNIYYNNTVVDPSCDYIYDATYRLITASGREHIGQNLPPSPHDEFRTNLPQPGDGAAMRNYTQSYQYDEVGNILKMIHAAGTGSWTRTYNYESENNRLKNNAINDTIESYSYDAHGNIKSLNHLPSLTWNFKDQLQQVDLGGGGTAYYVYDGSGHRMRKVIERQGGMKEDRIYAGEIEVYRKTDSAGNIQEETETLHVMDGNRTVAIVETKTIENGSTIQDADRRPLMRFQYSNHLGSSSLEMDENALIISYEEYHPYGTTAYQAKNPAINAAVKRYRYTAKERDEETGLEYHGARYYLPWLGRWLNADPGFLKDGLNIFQYAHSNPVLFVDLTGTESKKSLASILVETMLTVVDEAHRYQGFPSSDAQSDTQPLRSLIISVFVSIGEKQFPECSSKKHSRVELFNIGAQIYASQHHLGSLFSLVAREGDNAYEKHEESTTSLGYQFIIDDSGYGNLIFGPMTKADYRREEERHAQAGRRGIQYGFDLINSMGGPMGEGGEGPGEARETQWGAPIDPVSPSVPTGDSSLSSGSSIPFFESSGTDKYTPPEVEGVIIKANPDHKTHMGAAALGNRTKQKIVELSRNKDLLANTDMATLIIHADKKTGELLIDGAPFTIEEVAKILIDQGWKGGFLRLISCYSGKCTITGGNNAQRLADALNKENAFTVVGAGEPGTEKTIIHPSGPNSGISRVWSDVGYINPIGKGWHYYTPNN